MTNKDLPKSHDGKCDSQFPLTRFESTRTQLFFSSSRISKVIHIYKMLHC